MRNLFQNKYHLSFSGIVFFYTLIFVLCAKNYLYSIGPDYVNYYGIATHYANGNIYSAINTWWSPLYSWLMVPFIMGKLDALWINKLIQFLTGIYFLWIIQLFGKLYLKNPIKPFVSLLFLPFLLYWAFISDTPDFLAAALLIHFFVLFLKIAPSSTKKQVIELGILGGFCFLAKSYNFYFIIFFSGFAIGLHFLNRKKINFKLVGYCMSSFLGIVFVWVLFMYWRSNQLMITSRAEAITCDLKMATKPATNLQLYDCAGLAIDEHSKYSNWEQPYLYQTVHYTQSFINQHNLPAKWGANALAYFKNYVSKFQLLLLIPLLALLYHKKQTAFTYFISFYLIYIGGHFFFHLEARFFIMPMILMMLGIILLVEKLLYVKSLIKFLPVAWLFLGALFFKTSINKLIEFKNFDVLMNAQKIADTQNVPSGKKIATEMGLFEEGLFLAFFTNNQCIGSLTNAANYSQKELVKHKADFLLQIENNELKLVRLPAINSDSLNSTR